MTELTMTATRLLNLGDDALREVMAEVLDAFPELGVNGLESGDAPSHCALLDPEALTAVRRVLHFLSVNSCVVVNPLAIEAQRGLSAYSLTGWIETYYREHTPHTLVRIPHGVTILAVLLLGLPGERIPGDPGLALGLMRRGETLGPSRVFGIANPAPLSGWDYQVR